LPSNLKNHLAKYIILKNFKKSTIFFEIPKFIFFKKLAYCKFLFYTAKCNLILGEENGFI